MLDFLINNWQNILFVVIIVVGAIIAIKLGYKKQIAQGVLELLVIAEKKYGSGTGEIKFACVANLIYAKLPSLARIFISSKMIGELIQNTFDSFKDYIEKQANS